MFDGVYFEYPKVISVLFIFIGCEALCRLKGRAFYFPHLGAFAAETVKPSYWLWLLKWASIILFIVGLMSPVKDTLYQSVQPPGYAMAIAVDASGSMQNGGFDPTNREKSRFEVVQGILKAFTARRTGDTVGMVVFGTHAFVASPPTNDAGLLAGIIERLYVDIAGKFTALYEAIAKAIVLLHDTPGKEKIVIVLTDGRNTPGAPVSPQIVEALAAKEKVRIYAIVIGRVQNPKESTLAVIAERSGGRYFTAADASALTKVYAQIDRLEKSPQRPPAVTVKQYYYVYPLFAGFMTLLLYVFLRNRRIV